MRPKLHHLILSGVLALALAACAADPTAPIVTVLPTARVPTAQPTPEGPTYPVQRGTVVDELQLDGRVAAAVEEGAFFTRDGYLAKLHVEPGAVVAQGQLLAEMDPGELPQQLANLQADLAATQRALGESARRRQLAVESAQLSLAAARDRLARVQQPPSASEIRVAEDAVERALINLEKIRAERSADKARAQAAIQLAADQLRNAQDAYSQALWQAGNKPLEQLEGEERLAVERAIRAMDAAKLAIEQARLNADLAAQAEVNDVRLAEQEVEAAQAELGELLQGPDPLEVAEAERAVRSAEISLQTASAGGEDPAGATRVAELERSIAEVQLQIDESRLLAPIAGTVAELSVKPGDPIEAYAPVITVIDPARLEVVVADLPADGLMRLNAGQPVSIELPLYPDEPLGGEITRLPSDQTSSSGVRGDPRLRIAFDPGNREMQVGDAARVTVVFRRVENALWLPPQAIRTFDQRRYVVVSEAGRERQIDVRLGVATDERVEIVDGLSEGMVVIGPPVMGG